MKIILAVAVVVAVQSFAVAVCPKGTEAFNGGCAAMPSPEDQTLAPMIATSDEKPSHHPEPAYLRGDVKVDMPVSMAGKDALADQERLQAESQGKVAAGIR